MILSRRRLLSGICSTPFIQLLPGLSLAASNNTSDKRFVLVILRGAMDGLAAVQPFGDPDLEMHRERLLVPEPQLLKLDSFFALHPALANMYSLYHAGELEVCHAVATPYRSRSHFDAQHVLETGLSDVQPSATGWLNRCAGYLSASSTTAMAVGSQLPKVLQGSNEVGSWSPDNLPGTAQDTLERLQRLYSEDAFLGARFEQGIMADSLVSGTGMGPGNRGAQNLAQLADAAARFLSQEDGPVIAVLESSGWDTHAGQGAEQGRLAQRLAELDNAINVLRNGLQSFWHTTQILVVTEFGRTVAVNGTGGTDHGTASAAFRTGGAVNGGRITTDWPGLASGNLLEGRDLRPTLDMRDLFRDAVRHILGHVPVDVV